jgi:hypothetical protein
MLLLGTGHRVFKHVVSFLQLLQPGDAWFSRERWFCWAESVAIIADVSMTLRLEVRTQRNRPDTLLSLWARIEPKTPGASLRLLGSRLMLETDVCGRIMAYAGVRYGVVQGLIDAVASLKRGEQRAYGHLECRLEEVLRELEWEADGVSAKPATTVVMHTAHMNFHGKALARTPYHINHYFEMRKRDLEGTISNNCCLNTAQIVVDLGALDLKRNKNALVSGW